MLRELNSICNFVFISGFVFHYFLNVWFLGLTHGVFKIFIIIIILNLKITVKLEISFSIFYIPLVKCTFPKKNVYMWWKKKKEEEIMVMLEIFCKNTEKSEPIC